MPWWRSLALETSRHHLSVPLQAVLILSLFSFTFFTSSREKLGELRREKQKLVEKIMDQYRVLEPSVASPTSKAKWETQLLLAKQLPIYGIHTSSHAYFTSMFYRLFPFHKWAKILNAKMLCVVWRKKKFSVVVHVHSDAQTHTYTCTHTYTPAHIPIPRMPSNPLNYLCPPSTRSHRKSNWIADRMKKLIKPRAGGGGRALFTVVGSVENLAHTAEYTPDTRTPQAGEMNHTHAH